MSSTNTVCDIIIFGSMGDLAQRKLLPSLYQLERAGLIDAESRIVAAARKDLELEAFLETAVANLRRFTPATEIDEESLERFVSKLTFCWVSSDVNNGYQALVNTLDQEPERTRIYYYATPASMYGNISEALQASGCLNSRCRVVLEKPIGHSLESSIDVNEHVAQFFDESQVYRIDHYLGKETVQNLIALRFANPLFGSQWNQGSISHVEITVSEKVGIEGRWGYFDRAGQLRDMVQNHLLQLLCLTAMDPPDDLSADMIRNEKVKVLKALQPITADRANTHVIRGRYRSGIVDGKPVPGYMEEEGANLESTTETFVALKVNINNWRWAGVPFYLRTGKRMAEKLSQITIHFKPSPHFIFDESQRNLAHNKLIIRLQPEEGISLQILNKDQGIGHDMHLRSEPLELNFSQAFDSTRIPDAYERLLLEVIRGNQNLFVRRDEIEAAWKWCDQLLEHWKKDNREPHAYAAGSWGPKAADLLVMKDGNYWHEDQ